MICSFEVPLVDVVVGQNLACLGGNDFQAALSHEGVVDVVEFGPFADDDGFVELYLNSGTVPEPRDGPDGTHSVAADYDHVFGLQCAKFVKIHQGRVRNFLVSAVHSIGDPCEYANEG